MQTNSDTSSFSREPKKPAPLSWLD